MLINSSVYIALGAGSCYGHYCLYRVRGGVMLMISSVYIVSGAGSSYGHYCLCCVIVINVNMLLLI